MGRTRPAGNTAGRAVRLTILVAVLAALLAAPVATAQGGVIQEAASAPRGNSVFVHPAASPGLTQAEAEALRSRITERDAGPMYIAVLPQRAASEAGGSVTEALTQLGSDVGRQGTYAIVVGRTFRAGSPHGVPEGATGRAAEEAKRDYEQALGAYERASAAVDRRAPSRTSSRSAAPPRRAASRWPRRAPASRAAAERASAAATSAAVGTSAAAISDRGCTSPRW